MKTSPLRHGSTGLSWLDNIRRTLSAGLVAATINSHISMCVMILISACLAGGVAQADQLIYDWKGSTNDGLATEPLILEGTDAAALCDQAVAYHNAAFRAAGGTRTFHVDAIIPTGGGPPSGPDDVGGCHLVDGSGAYVIDVGFGANPTAFFAYAKPSVIADNGSCCQGVPGKSGVADPINPTTGNVFSADHDLTSKSSTELLTFSRFYNSADSTSNDLSAGWRHSFSRGIKASYDSVSYLPYVLGNADYSALYGTATNACTNGFLDIQNRVSNWASASASYTNGVCTLTKNGVVIGTLEILYSSKYLPPPLLTLVGFDAIRDDGMAIRFTLQSGAITAPPNVTLNLQQTSSGYTLADANDTTETYDTNGRLLSITSHAGLVQIMSYDTSGKLTGVSDNFGHQLILTYNTQNRLITVTRQ